MCKENIKKIFFFNFLWRGFHSRNKFMLHGLNKTNMTNTTVGTRFSAQAQNVWDLGPVNPVQQIYREWVKELGFSAWITVRMGVEVD